MSLSASASVRATAGRARTAALDALAAMDAAELPTAIDSIGNDAPVRLRKRAVELLSKSTPDKAVPVLTSLLDNASLDEKQAALRALGDIADEASVQVLREQLQRLINDEVPAGVRLDLVLAATEQGDPSNAELLAKYEALSESRGPMGPWQDCLEGGDARAGRSIFFDNEATRCTRCHTLNDQGGNAGPALDSIGKQRERDYLLESLIAPSAKIADGFGSTTVELHNGNMMMGFVTKDQDGELTIVSIDGKPTVVPWQHIKSRTPNSESAMPGVGGTLDRRQIRDLIEFLMQQKK